MAIPTDRMLNFGGVTNQHNGMSCQGFEHWAISLEMIHGPEAEALGGIPDAWSMVRAHGRLKFQTASFPSNVTHVTGQKMRFRVCLEVTWTP